MSSDAKIQAYISGTGGYVPPRVVTIPAAARIPGTSSDVVSMRTRMTDVPSEAIETASSERKTILPVAVPGLAPIPFARS